MIEATFTDNTKYMAKCYINGYNINRSLTIVLLYRYHTIKSVPVGTVLRIILDEMLLLNPGWLYRYIEKYIHQPGYERLYRRRQERTQRKRDQYLAL